MADYLETSRKVWERASDFPADKEAVYPEHAQIEEFDRHAGKNVLEYGCGGGSDALSYWKRGCDVTFVDIVPRNLAMTVARFAVAPKLREDQKCTGLLLEDSAPIPVEYRSFDVVHCHGVLHHIMDPAPVVQEFAKVLKPGGLAYVMLYTETLFQLHAPQIVRLMNQTGLSVWEAFGWSTDGEDIPYAKAYEKASALMLFMENGFTCDPVQDIASYQGDIFRRYRLTKA